VRVGESTKRSVAASALALLLTGCTSKPPPGPHGLPEKTFELPAPRLCKRPLTGPEIGAELDALTSVIGRYPPRFVDEAHRESTYTRWAEAIACAEALPLDRHEEGRLFLLAELYRQGHNLDVIGAGEKAAYNVDRCLVAFPASTVCNTTASYLYLSVEPTEERLASAERSLATLRQLALPGYSDDAEAGFVFLYIYRRDPERVRGQIARYLELFPGTSRADDFRKIRDHLGEEIRFRHY
jgi:hypothetical protein